MRKNPINSPVIRQGGLQCMELRMSEMEWNIDGVVVSENGKNETGELTSAKKVMN